MTPPQIKHTAPTHEEAKAWLKAHPGETLSGFAAHYPGGFAEAIKLAREALKV